MYSGHRPGALPTHQKPRHMSYMLGPHMKDGPIYFGGDTLTSLCTPDKLPLDQSPPPAWLVADWILAHKSGHPLSEVALYYATHPEHWNDALRWLADMD